MRIITNILSYLSSAIYILPAALISLTFHECAHGFVAYKLGDPTARGEGRLTLNPLKHIDPVGFLMMFIVRFGWAKPVPVNPIYFKNPQKGMMFTALAGPVSNLILAVLSSLVYVLCVFFIPETDNIVINYIMTFLLYMTLCNIGLAVFNLIPVHPMDGSRVLGYFLPQSYTNFMYRYGNYIYIAFVLLLVATDYVNTVIGTVQNFLFRGLVTLWVTVINIFI